jgi:hypothetical protein
MYSILYIAATISIVAYVCISSYNPSLIYVKSSLDNRTYIVRNLLDKQEAADTLAKVRRRMEELVERFKEKFGRKDARVNLMASRFNSNEIREAIPRKNQTSYSINKGERVVICLRSRDKQETLVDVNTLVFVAFHEMAHIMTISIGHKTEFWENFRFILAHAIEWKLYDPVDYKKTPKPYCGIKISESPLENKDIQKYLQYS